MLNVLIFLPDYDSFAYFLSSTVRKAAAEIPEADWQVSTFFSFLKKIKSEVNTSCL